AAPPQPLREEVVVTHTKPSEGTPLDESPQLPVSQSLDWLILQYRLTVHIYRHAQSIMRIEGRQGKMSYLCDTIFNKDGKPPKLSTLPANGANANKTDEERVSFLLRAILQQVLSRHL
ncbi:hypothetical protein ACLOJK_014680, partial [Asimina triloba]